MVIPYTGLVFLFGSFVHLYLSRKFWVVYKKENNNTAKFFGYGFLFIGLNYLINSAPALFLVENSLIWRIINPIYSLLMVLGWGILLYSVVIIKFPQRKDICRVLYAVYLIFYLVILVLYPPVYYYKNGVLTWEIETIVLFPTIFVVPFITLVLLIFFFNETKKVNEPKIKVRSLGLFLMVFFTASAFIVDLLFITFLRIDPVFSDLNYFILFSVIFLTLIKTWFTEPKSKFNHGI